MRRPFFEIRPSPIEGRGAFAVRRIRKGTRLIEYTGERLTPAAADTRYDDDRRATPHVCCSPSTAGRSSMREWGATRRATSIIRASRTAKR